MSKTSGLLHPEPKPFTLSGARLRLQAAFDATPVEHQAGVLAQRNPGLRSQGSTFLTPVTWEALAAADWERYEHAEVAPGCQAWKALIPGFLGVMSLDALPPGSQLYLRDGHATGFVEAVYEAPEGARVPVEYTTAIVGTHEGVEMVFTVFPGDPVKPSSLPAAEHKGREVTLAEARALGFRYVKISG
jgi:hypothetical protein